MIEAAGGLVLRDDRIAVVHRPHRDDWTLPKGHLDPGETDEAAALREVLEETGLQCAIVADAGETTYLDRKGRAKRVRYFVMSVLDGRFAVNDEVDELRWLSIEELSLLTYPADAELVAANWPR